MNKASKALRRSSIRLKSFNSGHSELNLIVSDMKEVRSTAKQFAEAQDTVWKDLFKWASKEKNESIRESFSYLIELNRLWTEVQMDFIEQLNKFKYAFEMILEGEMSVDRLREHLNVCEMRENRLKKDLQKAIKKDNSIEERNIEKKLVDERLTIKSTQVEKDYMLFIEVAERANENEAVKAIRLKEGLLKLSESYIDLAHKSNIIFNGQKSIAGELPNVEEHRRMQNVRFRGSSLAKQTVSRVKEAVKTYKQPSVLEPGAPPPYSTCTQHPNFYPQPAYNGYSAWANRSSMAGTGCYYDRPPEDYEAELAGAVGGARL